MHLPIFRWQAVVALLVLAIAVGALVAVIWLPGPSETIRRRLVARLNSDLKSEAHIGSLQLSLRPSPTVVLRELVMRHKGRRDVPPLIRVRSLTAHLTVRGLMAHRLESVEIEGLEIFIPPGDRPRVEPKESGHEIGSASEKPTNPTATPSGWFINQLIATDTMLLLAVTEPGKPPLDFDIHHLTMSSVGADREMGFQAALRNPRPPGEIETKGTFGPWQKDEPRLTPLRATYTYSNADLGTFKGIGGILDSHGAFGGVLERIEASGQTTTPDFQLSIAGNPVPLTTRYEAIIDGTNGNTILKHIDATLGESRLIVSGAVIGKPGVDGRTITIDATIADGRLEDVLRLAVKGKTPPLEGDVAVKTRILLPPGDRDVVDKLQLDGTFRVTAARFTSLDIQKKLEELSRRGRGKPDEEGGPSPVSNMAGSFTLKNAEIAFQRLTFSVQGAAIVLSGRHNLRRETLDFRGTVRLQANVSQTMTGWKRFFLKPLDLLFKRDGAGAVLPIRIEGTRTAPAFKVDVKSALLRRDPS